MRNLAKAKLLADEPVMALMSIVHNPAIVEMAGLGGFDLICIDGEHSSLDRQTLENLVRAAELVNITPIVRTAINHSDEILPFLDTAVQGLLVPHVNTVERAKMAVDAVKYAPLGTRGLSGGRVRRYDGVNPAEQIENFNRETLVMIQIEEKEAVDNLPQLLEVEGIDMFVIGPGDLSHSLGYTGQAQHPEVLRVVDECIETILAGGQRVGIRHDGFDLSRKRIADGVRLIFAGDGRLFQIGMKHFLDQMKRPA